MAKPAIAWETHYSSRKQPYRAEAFSESEINAIVQLIQLSSAADCYSDHHSDTDLHQEDDSSRNNNSFSFLSFSKVKSGKSVDAASSSYSSSSPPLTEAEKGELAEEDRDGGGGHQRNLGERRKNKRYRSIAELYRVTDETVLKKKKEISETWTIECSNLWKKVIEGEAINSYEVGSAHSTCE